MKIELGIYKLLFVFTIITICFFIKRANSDANIEDVPLKGNFASKPGHYELAIRHINSIVDPGDVVEIELYITGYGQIESSKLVSYPSGENIYDNEASKVTYGFKKQNDRVFFGGQETNYRIPGITITFNGGIPFLGGKYTTMFFDTNEQSLQISTEKQLGSAPIYLSLKTLRKSKPGTYFLYFYFTYFNGVEWKGSSHQVQFTIQNILQRNEYIAWFLAIVAAASTVIVAVFTIPGVNNWIRFVALIILAILSIVIYFWSH